MRDPLFEDGPLALYRQSPIRKDWKHPSQEDVADSLRKAHEVNRKLIVTVNELNIGKRNTDKEMAGLRRDLNNSQTRGTILTAILSSAVTSSFIGGIIAIFKLWHG